MDQGREPLRENLAKFARVSADKITINRNAAEAIGLAFDFGGLSFKNQRFCLQFGQF